MCEMIVPDDQEVLREVQRRVREARQFGASNVFFVPVDLLERLIERATRPHD